MDELQLAEYKRQKRALIYPNSSIPDDPPHVTKLKEIRINIELCLARIADEMDVGHPIDITLQEIDEQVEELKELA
jgi:hypothetical protein